MFKSSPRSSVMHYSVLMACICMAVGMRISNFEFVFTDITGHLNFIDTDCYYHLRRLVHFLTNFPQILMFDPLADWPTGSPVDWPEGFLLLLGLPLKLVGASSFRELELGVCILMVALGVFTCLVGYWLSRRFFENKNWAILSFFLLSANFLLVRFSCFGQVDHHIVEAIFPLLMLLLSWKAFTDHRLSAGVGLGLMTAFSLLISSSGIFMIGTLYALYAVVLGARENQRIFWVMTSVSILTLLPYVVWSVSVRGDPASIYHPSYFHLMLISVLAVSSFFGFRYRDRLGWYLLGLAGAVALLGILNWPPVLMEPLKRAISYVFSGSGLMGNVSEAVPIFMTIGSFDTSFMHLNFGYLVYLIPIGWISLLFWKRLSMTERSFLLCFSLMSIPGIAQKRFAQLFVGLYVIFIVWLLVKIHDWLEARQIRVSAFVALFFTAMSIFPLIDFGFAPRGTSRDVVDIGSVARFIQTVPIKAEEAWQRLSLKTPVAEGVLANPNMGHLLLYTTGLGVVTNTYYHWQGFEIDFKARQAKTDEELKKVLSENKIRYWLLADDVLFFELQYKMRGMDFSKYVKRDVVNGRPSTFFQMNELTQDFAWMRLLSQEWPATDFEILYQIRFKERHFYNFVKGLRFTGF